MSGVDGIIRYVRLTCGHTRVSLMPVYDGRVLPCFECKADRQVDRQLSRKEAEGE